jgi:hypothetical protein
MSQLSSELSDLTLHVTNELGDESGPFWTTVSSLLQMHSSTLMHLCLDLDIFTLIIENISIIFSNLEHLELCYAGRDEPHSHPETKLFASPLHFPSLRKITGASGEEFTFSTRFSSAVDPALTVINLADSDCRDRNITDTERFFSAIAKTSSSLRKLRLESVFLLSETDEADMARLVNLLLCCGSLEELHLDVSIVHVDLCFILSNDDFLAMAQAWKYMQRIGICCSILDGLIDNPEDVRPSASLAVIETFLLHCPSIDHITLTLDATNLPPAPLNSRVHARSLKSINFAFSPLADDRKKVARWLGDLCPADGISSFGLFEDQWADVRKEVEHLQSYGNDLRKELDKIRLEKEELRHQRDSAVMQVRILEVRSRVRPAGT